MNLKSTFIVLTLLSVLLISFAGPAFSEERTMYLSVCQELVNQARAYEARAVAHSRIAKGFMNQIENLAKVNKTQGTIQAMENLFSLYDQNRELERKFRELYRKASDEAKQCMKSVE